MLDVNVIDVSVAGDVSTVVVDASGAMKYAAAAAASAAESASYAAVAATTRAPLASPTFTGTPAAPTAAAGTNTTQLATTAFVKTAVDNLVASAPGTLDTLNELAAALGDDPNFATTVTTALSSKEAAFTGIDGGTY